MTDMKMQDMQGKAENYLRSGKRLSLNEYIAFYAYSCFDSRIVEDQSRLGLSHRLEHTRNTNQCILAYAFFLHKYYLTNSAL